ncbi:MAG: alpha/beta hydrolase [Gammaproteobacteria bacterium]|nr:alpha/beta hydrolase [Gammaproteobacteria bacterium]
MSKNFYIQTKHGQVHARRYGQANQTIICLHPMPYSGSYYDTFCNDLISQTEMAAISLDMLGYGQSSKIDEPITIQDYALNVIEVIKSIKESEELTGEIILLGFHTGSAIANEVAILEPELIDRVIFVTYPFFDAKKRGELVQSQTKGSIDESIDCLKGMWEFTISNRTEGISIERAYENFIDQVKNMPVSWYGFYAMFNYPSEERLPLLEHETLIINDVSSLTEPTKIADSLIKGSKYYELEDVKGGIFELNTDQIIDHIQSFLGADKDLPHQTRP